MSSKTLTTLRDFSLGINAKDGPSLINDAELVDVENAIIGKGFIMKRHGYEIHASAPVVQTLNWSEFGAKKWSEI